MQIQCLISKNSWLNDNYKKQIKLRLGKFSKKILFVNNHLRLKKNYKFNLIFSYFKKIPIKYLKYSEYNLVIHGSNLPKGRGMSPISWQILKGFNKITFTLFDANDKYDQGHYYLKKKINFGKTSLFKEIKKKQFEEMIDLYKKFILKSKKLKKKKQNGKSTYYKLRLPKDSKLNIKNTIEKQFNLFRIVDNDRYPAFFIYKKKKFLLRIEEDEKNSNK